MSIFPTDASNPHLDRTVLVHADEVIVDRLDIERIIECWGPALLEAKASDMDIYPRLKSALADQSGGTDHE